MMNRRNSRALPADIWEESFFLPSFVARSIFSDVHRSAAQAASAICIKAYSDKGNFWLLSTLSASGLANAHTLSPM